MKPTLPKLMLFTVTFAQMAYAEEMPTRYAVQQKTSSNQFWWPDRLDLSPLRQHAAESSPMDSKFDYAKEFNKLDLKAVKADIEKLMKTSAVSRPRTTGT